MNDIYEIEMIENKFDAPSVEKTFADIRVVNAENVIADPMILAILATNARQPQTTDTAH